jgi:hypothetical protein
MLLGIGFIAVLTATVASQFIQNDTGTTEMLETLRRIETDVAELKGRLPRPDPRSSGSRGRARLDPG